MMWGRFYWGTKGEERRKAEGIVVLFAWLSSQEKHLKPYVDLYWSLGWGCLICHTDFLTLFFPDKAATLSRGILDELIKGGLGAPVKVLQCDLEVTGSSPGSLKKFREVKNRPLPIVLAAFSGGSKGCLYKLIQLVEGKCEGQMLQDDYQLVKLCLSGQMYDSSPVDFTSDLGYRFALQPSVIGLSRPPRLVAWMAKAFSYSLDALFINRFETERAAYWQTLYSSVSMGPFLIFCSEDDELAPYKIVCGFAQLLRELGGDVNLMVWSSSPHVAHYRYHKAEYKAAVAEFFTKASLKYSRTQQLHRADCVPESASNLHGTTPISNNSLKMAAMGSSEDFFLQASMEYDGTMDSGSLIDEHNKGQIFQPPSNMNPQGALSQVLGNVCVPKNIEDWDIKPTSSSSPPQNFSSSNIKFWDDKFIKRSRL